MRSKRFSTAERSVTPTATPDPWELLNPEDPTSHELVGPFIPPEPALPRKWNWVTFARVNRHLARNGERRRRRERVYSSWRQRVRHDVHMTHRCWTLPMTRLLRTQLHVGPARELHG